MRNPRGDTFVPAAARARRGGPPCWFWLPSPALDATAGAFEWAGLELRPSAGRGLGVFATGALPAGLLPPYGGLEVSPAQLRWLAKHDRDRYVARTSTGPAAGNVDADPAHLPAGHAFAWPGSRLNEASRTNELYNCLVAVEELDAVFGDSWLDCENVDARAMPPRRNRYRATATAQPRLDVRSAATARAGGAAASMIRQTSCIENHAFVHCPACVRSGAHGVHARHDGVPAAARGGVSGYMYSEL
jgi:hypothetical protein